MPDTMPAGVGWKVVSVTEGTGPTPTGGFTKGRTVTYQLTPGGQTGTVFVPLAGWGEDTVAAAINRDAATLHAVANLTSG